MDKLLEKIGIIAIVVSIYYIIMYIKKEQYIKEAKFIEKNKILIKYHYVISGYFKELKKKSHHDDDEGFYKYREIFGHQYFTKYESTNIEKMILTKVKELEEITGQEKFKQELQEIIETAQKEYQKEKRKLEFNLYEIKVKHLKYEQVLNKIFPNDKVCLTKSEILNELINGLNVSQEQGEHIFNTFIQFTNGVRFLYNERATDEYWYSDIFVKRHINKLQKEIEDLTSTINLYPDLVVGKTFFKNIENFFKFILKQILIIKE